MSISNNNNDSNSNSINNIQVIEKIKNVNTRLGEWKQEAQVPTRMSLESFWYTMQRWSMNPTFMNKAAKKFIILSKVQFNQDDQFISEHIYPKNYSGSFQQDDSNSVVCESCNSNNNTDQEDSQNKDNTSKEKRNKHDDDGLDEDEQDIFQNDTKDINSKDSDESELPTEYLDANVKTIVVKRHLIPRLANRDPELGEHVYHLKDKNRADFYPQLPDDDHLNARRIPFFYPKLLGISIEYRLLDSVADKEAIDTFMQEERQRISKTNITNKKKNNKPEPEKPLERFKALLTLSVIYFKDYQPKQLDKSSLQILEKVNRWGLNYEIGYQKKATLDQIIPKTTFISLYEELKQKYKNMVEGWEEITKTDPKKFVFEDVAIAAYLIGVWRKENADAGVERKQRFVDIGCGNGLLVNILNKEGYPGIGVDLRARRVWQKYDQDIQSNLIEQSILPNETTYPDYDWLIGNHSDELTPWVPMMASKVPGQRFFLLPCCFFNFNHKFNSNDTRIGRYATYLNFIENLIKELGFGVVKETLRIPSTKNFAFVTTAPTNLTPDQLAAKREVLLKKSNYTDFKPREKEIKWVAQKRFKAGQINPHLEKRKQQAEQEQAKDII
ncbi:hypothetical protein CYY_005310 [Polysphondylium violaceum]|uniref:tRNA (uracil-O(2)-)-methyltransferase n=1 Tax=Polysphondylium violaceum TaxID=133409 RepID=A0A8J4UYQ2_9MYCE|nr:hypothetical protein CYY_005310 [Polysphondylium violaceum]